MSPGDQAAIYGYGYFRADGDWSAGYFRAYENTEVPLRREATQVLGMVLRASC
ncbi:MAG: hypothetical protein WEG36_14805 [Gemmatimonadota bacterium]